MTRSPIPTTESHQIFWFILNGVTTAIRLNHATGFSTKTINEWARDTAEVSADGTGGPNPLDRVGQIVGHLATRGEDGEAAIVMIREYLERLFVSVLGDRPAEPTTADLRLSAVAIAIREVGEAFSKCDPQNPDPELQREVAEAITALQAVARAFAPAPSPLPIRVA